jgi:hypothetical protein
VKLLPVAVGAAAFVAELSGRGDVDVVIGAARWPEIGTTAS